MSRVRIIALAVVFATAMGALEHGGWWWLWFAVSWLGVMGPRLPLIGRVKVSAANRYILRENRKVRRERRSLVRDQQRLAREKARNSKCSRAKPL